MDGNSLKKCCTCGELKSLSEFNNHKGTPDDKDYRCKVCAREHSRLYRKQNPDKAKASVRKATIKKKFNMTEEQYNNLLIKQNYSCAICGRDFYKYRAETHRYFCIDHNHKTGEIRGLLCSPCNRSIGLLGDNAGILRTAANYIERKINE